MAQANNLMHLGCWAHARGRFAQAEAALPKQARTSEQPATQFIAAIGELYAIESRVRECKLDAEKRLRLRQVESLPVLERIERLLLAHRHKVLPQSLLGKVLGYLAGEWPKLVRFADNGGYPIDINACGNAIRPFVVGRRNWLLSDTVRGANASANPYSLIETAKANRIGPCRYLRVLFAALPKATTVEDYEALLPRHIVLPAQ